MDEMLKQVAVNIEQKRETLIEILQQMVQIPSPTSDEGRLARYVENALTKLGMSVFVNEIGDVTGIIQVQESAPLFLLNTHLDQAEPGDMEDPYSGSIMDGIQFGIEGDVILGRGTNGQKASLAAMIIAAMTMIELDIPLQRGFAINAGVMEECGGHLSPKYLIEHDKVPVFAVLCAEHTNLRVVNAQRGMIHIQLRVEGIGAHAAAPEGAISALVGMARIILALEELGKHLPDENLYGRALVSLNKISVLPNVVNMIPDVCEAVIDVRQPATISRDSILDLVKNCIAETVIGQPGLDFEAGIELKPVTSYTGIQLQSDGCMYPFFTPEEDPLVRALQASVLSICGPPTEPELWSISSEAGYFSTVAGLPVVAFGPGEDRFTHNRLEHVRIDDLVATAKVFASMIVRMCVNSSSS
jgi:putative selenium metabolism hydrolase